MILCCLVRAITHFRDGDRRIWSNGGLLITMEKTQRNSVKNLFQCHFIHSERHMKHLGLNQRLHRETVQCLLAQTLAQPPTKLQTIVSSLQKLVLQPLFCIPRKMFLHKVPEKKDIFNQGISEI